MPKVCIKYHRAAWWRFAPCKPEPTRRNHQFVSAYWGLWFLLGLLTMGRNSNQAPPRSVNDTWTNFSWRFEQMKNVFDQFYAPPERRPVEKNFIILFEKVSEEKKLNYWKKRKIRMLAIHSRWQQLILGWNRFLGTSSSPSVGNPELIWDWTGCGYWFKRCNIQISGTTATFNHEALILQASLILIRCYEY